MAQAAALVINDGQATPVATTFGPESVAPALSVFSDKSAGISIGYRRVKVSTSFSNGKSTVNRGKLSIEIPVTSTLSGITTVAYTLRANLDLILPEQATTAQRNDLYAFVKNSLSNALVQGALRDLDPIY